MAKPTPGVRLMRTLARAAKTQQSTLAKLLGSYVTLSKKSPRKSAPRKPSSTSAIVQALPPEARRHRRPSPALAALIGSVCEQHPIDRRRVYACGLSAGAGMAAVLALNHPELIAAVGLHSGPVFGTGHTPMGALHVMRHGAPAQPDAAILGVLE